MTLPDLYIGKIVHYVFRIVAAEMLKLKAYVGWIDGLMKPMKEVGSGKMQIATRFNSERSAKRRIRVTYQGCTIIPSEL